MTTVTEAIAAAKALLLEANTPGAPRVDVFISKPAPVMDKDGAAHPYIVLHPSPGTSVREEEPLTSSPGLRLWRVQATCAGGDVERCLRAVERLQATLVGVQLAPTTGFVREEGDLGAIRPDITVSPNRWFAPIDLVTEL